MEEGFGALWLIAVVGGPVLLGLAFAYAILRRRRRGAPARFPEGSASGDQPAVKSPTFARQGTTEGVGRYVLGLSLPLAIVALAVVYFVFFV